MSRGNSGRCAVIKLITQTSGEHQFRALLNKESGKPYNEKISATKITLIRNYVTI